MLTPEVKKFIDDCVAQQISFEDIKKTLLGNAWTAEATDEVLKEYQGGKLQENPVLPTTPTLASETMMVDSKTPTSATTEMNQGADASTPHSKNKVVISIVVIVLLLISGGGAAAYMLLTQKDLTPDEVLAAVQEKLPSLNSLAFNTKLEISGKNETNQPGGSKVAGSEIELTISGIGTTINVGGEYGWDFDVAYSMDGNATMGPMSLILDGAIDVRKIGSDVYVRVTKFPEFIKMFTGDTFTEYADTWIKIDNDIAKSTFDSAIDGASPLENQANRDEMKEVFMRNWPIILVELKTTEADKIDGQEMYHYSFSLDETKLRALINEVPDLIDASDIRSTDGKEQVIKALAGTTGELWVGKEDYLPHRVTVAIPIDVDIESMGMRGKTSVSVALHNFNDVSPISAPEKSTNLDKLLKGPQSKSRDAKRISDLGQLQLASELYFDMHQRYAAKIDDLVQENVLPRVPLDPKGTEYYYAVSRDGKTYQLGTSLENKDHFSLENDNDGRIGPNPNFGDDTVGCAGEPSLYCYDIAQ